MMNRRIVSIFCLALLLLPNLASGVPDAREITRLAESRDADERLRAVRLLSEVKGPGVTRRLIELTADPDAEVRSRAEAVLRSRREAADLTLLASRGLRHPRPTVRRAALRLLVAARSADLAEHLDRALSDRDADTREAAVSITVNALGGRGLPSLAAAVSRGRDGRPKAAALLAVAGLDRDLGIALARRALADRELEVRVAAIELLSALPGEEGRAITIRALSDESWSVRITAIRLLAIRAEKEAVAPLIDALGRESGRLRHEAGEALAALTGVGLPPDPKRWSAWWKASEATFVVPSKPARPPEEKDGSVVTFHSIPVVSRNVAFVLDRSRSMRQRIARGDTRTKGEVVVAELEGTLSRMKKPARFLLVAFRTEVSVFAPRPVPVASRRRAVDWYSGLEAEGRTNLYDALRVTLSEPAVDTVYILTDGAPSEGEYRERGAILTAVARLNRYRKSVIHTVDIGGGTTGKKWRGFLAELSGATGGRHVRR